MGPRPARDVHGWPDEALAERVVTFAGPEAAVVRVQLRKDADEPGQQVWRATVLDAALRRIAVNTAVSQILARLIREHFRGVDWSRAWDYHLPERRLREPARTVQTTPATESPGTCCTCGNGAAGQERVFP